MSRTAFRSHILHFNDDPAHSTEPGTIMAYDDGVLVVEDGHILALGDPEEMADLTRNINVQHIPDGLIMPGFVDAHVHYPQIDMIASYGKHLLDWLGHYAFPAEIGMKRFPDRAIDTAAFFLDELLRNGTTSALVFATVHAHTVDALFGEALKRNLRLISGKVMMDAHAPDDLMDTAQSSYDDTKALIEKWHGKGRLGYAVTPRFALTSTEEQLALAGRLLSEHPGVLLHTHLCENTDEIARIDELFPGANGYLDVYKRAGLVTQKSVFAHGVHLSDADRATLSGAQSALAHCPTSNLFLGSGLFDLAAAQAADITLGLGTDVGGGTSLGLFATMNEAYKVSQLRGHSLSPYDAFYLATLGGARALHIDDYVGNFAPGKEADFVVLDLAATPLIKRRLSHANTFEQMLFALMILGDDRAVQHTYVAGALAHDRDA
jgi:guanine deaminase